MMNKTHGIALKGEDKSFLHNFTPEFSSIKPDSTIYCSIRQQKYSGGLPA
ncbi:hypothetical protein VT99_11223 [Candidatus Electrothrix marina]|uniref:Uncharacterized protein n=1 Tax=Candidatus Electrothrix marina TaxID=1859130 RepID=A0A444J501_9BACT|nr:hypothetical protein VT99_11223 [Candidatus Electrothrix marina]